MQQNIDHQPWCHRRSRLFCRSCVEICFVKRFAGFWLPEMLLKKMSLVRPFPCTQRLAQSRLRICPALLLRATPMAATASENNSTPNDRPKLLAMFRNPSACVVAFARPCNSASPELSNILRWVEGQIFNMRLPKSRHPPEVDRLVTVRPATPVPAKVVIAFVASCHPCRYTILWCLQGIGSIEQA